MKPSDLCLRVNNILRVWKKQRPALVHGAIPHRRKRVPQCNVHDGNTVRSCPQQIEGVHPNGIRGSLGDGNAAVICAHVADVAETEQDRNGIEGIIESGVTNAVVVGVKEGKARVLPFPLAMNDLLRMGSNVMLLLLRMVVEESVENTVSHSFHLN